MKVIEGKKQERGILTCPCSNTTYKLVSDGTIECAHCGSICTNAHEWKLPPAPRGAMEVGEAPANVVHMMDSKYALKRCLAEMEADEPKAIVAITDSGQVRTFGVTRNDAAYKKWLKKRLKTGFQLLTGEYTENNT